MKNFILILLIGTVIISCSSNDDDTENIQNSCDFIDFKYYNNTQYYLGEMSNDYLLIGIDLSYTDAQIHLFISSLTEFDQSYNYTTHLSGQYQFKEIPLKFTNSKNCKEITQIITRRQIQ